MDGLKIRRDILINVALVVVALFFLFFGLAKAKSFLAPLVTAIVLALLVLPVTKKLERWGVNRVLATLSSTLLLVVVTGAFLTMVFYQIKGFASDFEEIQERLEMTLEEATSYLAERTPLSHQQIAGYRADTSFRQRTADEQRGGMHLAMRVSGYLTQLLIVLVYVFLFIHFRKRFREFILKFFPHDRRKTIALVITLSSAVSRRYLAGKLLLMVFLAMLYFAGLFVSGLENAFLISLVAAALSIIPVVGNLFGYFIAIAVSLLSDGGTGTLIGITVTFALAQFIDTYILQPIILGDKVDVHPVFIIVSVVLGYLVWGIIGLVLAIPVFGVITVVCRHVPALHPFGYLFSRNDIDKYRS